MAQNVNPTFVKTPNWGATQITTGTGSSVAVTVYTGGANGSKITSLIATALNTTSAFDVQWGISSGGTLYVLGAVSVPVSAGTLSSVAAVNIMITPGLALDSDGNSFVFLPSNSYTLQVKSNATSSTWTTGAVINLIAPSIGDF